MDGSSSSSQFPASGDRDFTTTPPTAEDTVSLIHQAQAGNRDTLDQLCLRYLQLICL